MSTIISGHDNIYSETFTKYAVVSFEKILHENIHISLIVWYNNEKYLPIPEWQKRMVICLAPLPSHLP